MGVPWTVTMWGGEHGLPNYECLYCDFAVLDRLVAEDHAWTAHGARATDDGTPPDEPVFVEPDPALKPFGAFDHGGTVPRPALSPQVPAVLSQAEQERVEDLVKDNKAEELQEVADKLGLPTEGTKAELAERIVRAERGGE